ncbi:MAG: hypothetical protein RLZZ399_673 [Verrucomicrobiota bacterium]|jgi:hypothetical protein
MSLPRGLYEQIVTLGLQEKLEQVDPRTILTEPLHPAEIPDRIALHLSRQIELALSALEERDRLGAGLHVARTLLHSLLQLPRPAPCESAFPAEGGRLLRAISQLQPDGSLEEIVSPLIPLLDTTLLTNSPGEPRLLHQLITEIQSAQQIDVVMAFIRKTGVLPMLSPLRELVGRGGRIRVLTTVYTGSTERAALDQLAALVRRVHHAPARQVVAF